MLKYNLSQIDIISKKILSNLSNTDCIFLFGELGSGKTTFTRSLINGLQKKNKVSKTEVLSPTFNLLYEYEIKSIKVMHYDLYRLDALKEVDQLGIFENSEKVITIVEWPEKIKKNVENRLEITFYYENDKENRKLKFQGFGKWKNFKLDEI
tara:strand:- start:968 stop:1423 length:456 start_codon:yes stop_codon:yes gene_type:complete